MTARAAVKKERPFLDCVIGTQSGFPEPDCGAGRGDDCRSKTTLWRSLGSETKPYRTLNLSSNSARWGSSFGDQRQALSTWEGVIFRRLPLRLPSIPGSRGCPRCIFQWLYQSLHQLEREKQLWAQQGEVGLVCAHCLGRAGETAGRKCYSVLCLFNNFFFPVPVFSDAAREHHLIRGLAEPASAPKRPS